MNPLSGLRARPVAALGVLLAVGMTGCSSDREAVSAPPFGTVEVAPVTIPPLASPSSTPVVAVDSVAMVGDSITSGSRAALDAGFAALGLDDVEIDAVSGRRMLVDGSITSGLDAIEDIAESESPDLWVIALGTNDVGNYRVDEYGPAITELLEAIPVDAPLIWVDTYLDGHPDDSAAFNDVLRMTLAARGRATVADWSTIAPEVGVLADGVHPSELGAQTFADRVMAAVDAWSA